MSRLLPAILCAIAVLVATDAEARKFREDEIPNGDAYGCATCHEADRGGGPRNVFGLDIEATLVSKPIEDAPANWAQVWMLDSDGDGLTNGVELGDSDGDGKPNVGERISRPWDPTDPGPQEDTGTDSGTGTDPTDPGEGADRGCQTLPMGGGSMLWLGLGALAAYRRGCRSRPTAKA